MDLGGPHAAIDGECVFALGFKLPQQAGDYLTEQSGVLSSATMPATRCAVELLSAKSDHGTFGMAHQRWIVASGSAAEFSATAAATIGSCRQG
jgi:hypothetical protein